MSTAADPWDERTADLVERTPELRSEVLSPWYVLALGRIAELSARLEDDLRTVVAIALDLEYHAASALLLGSPTKSLVGTLRHFHSPLSWLPEAQAWANAVGDAIEERNRILHRAVGISYEDVDEGYELEVPMWMPARRGSYAVPLEELGKTMPELLRKMKILVDQVGDALDPTATVEHPDSEWPFVTVRPPLWSRPAKDAAS